MLFQPKKVNTGLDRIFIVISVLAMFFGFWAGGISYKEMSSTTWQSRLWPTSKELEQAFENLGIIKSSESPAEKEALRKKQEQEARDQTERYKKELLSRGHLVSEEDYPILRIEPPKVNVLIAAMVFGIFTFFCSLFSLRGLVLLVIWIKQGFNENR